MGATNGLKMTADAKIDSSVRQKPQEAEQIRCRATQHVRRSQQGAFCKINTCLLEPVRGLEHEAEALPSPCAGSKLPGLARDDLCKVHQAVYRSWADSKRVVWLALCRALRSSA